jgi:hypothetical protein
MKLNNKNKWQCALELDIERNIIDGDPSNLRKAIQNGADLRIHTAFQHNEHIDTSSNNDELVLEAAEFRTTYYIDNQWVAGIMTLRQPTSLPFAEFTQRPSMSFFMYNEDGLQCRARPYLEEESPKYSVPPDSPKRNRPHMTKMHRIDEWDIETNAPSDNFIYDFNFFRYFVRDDWKEVLSHDENGNIISGSSEELADAIAQGMEVKAGLRNLCSDLSADKSETFEHETFIQMNSCYFYTKQHIFVGGSHPLVRVAPNIPMKYQSNNWDFGWLMLRNDGKVGRRLVDPYTLNFTDSQSSHAIRWFVR